ncbi:helicase SKI2W-like [Camarhynchus parvulus]|uniref:helicase SKI2W-like n=1 Tax=Geospiza parvula TaxID=87175 RepID=UPI001237D7BD|nr:helicase SKI2W-like [Camarhynchus parvulus]
MMLGRPSPLQSRFRLTYPMILLLLRAPALRPHDLMRRSFAEFPLRRDATAQARRVAALREALAALGDPEGTPGGDAGDMGDLPQYHRAVVALRAAPPRAAGVPGGVLTGSGLRSGAWPSRGGSGC